MTPAHPENWPGEVLQRFEAWAAPLLVQLGLCGSRPEKKPKPAPRFGLSPTGGAYRIANETVAAMHADYLDGMDLHAVARKHLGRSSGGVRHMFVIRGLQVRHDPRGAAKKDPKTGRPVPVLEPTLDDIKSIVASSKTFCLPRILRLHWRKWPLEKRAELLAMMRARFPRALTRPETPFSSNVIPFDYATPEAWQILKQSNAGKPSRLWKNRLFPKSQGVIWDGRLWFWSNKARYVEGVAWTPEEGRKLLSHAILERENGKPVPAHHVVRYLDGNENNLDPANLFIAHRNDVARENQAAHYRRKSRAIVSLLLERKQPTTASDENTTPDLVTALRRRAA
jgi:hypothetical protein